MAALVRDLTVPKGHVQSIRDLALSQVLVIGQGQRFAFQIGQRAKTVTHPLNILPLRGAVPNIVDIRLDGRRVLLDPGNLAGRRNAPDPPPGVGRS